MSTRHFIDDRDFDRGERLELLERCWRLKHGDERVPAADAGIRPELRLSQRIADEQSRGLGPGALAHRNIALVMTKPSLRTRVSFTVAIRSLGGDVVEVGPQNTKLGKGEDLEEWAGVLGRMCDGIVARVHEHDFLLGLREHAGVPVINALSDDLHPCQALADLFTVWENARIHRLPGAETAAAYYGGSPRFAWLGDVSNVAHSLMLACASVGARVAIACPKDAAGDASLLAAARELHPLGADGIEICAGPAEAVAGADAVFTDTWVSMGQEGQSQDSELEQRFAGFQVDAAMMSRAKAEAVFMHCLPAEPGREVSAEVLRGPQSRALEGAENRMWTTRVLLQALFKA